MPNPDDWPTLDAMIPEGEIAESLALGEVYASLQDLSTQAPPRQTMLLRACALAVAVVARRLEARGLAAELMKETERP